MGSPPPADFSVVLVHSVLNAAGPYGKSGSGSPLRFGWTGGVGAGVRLWKSGAAWRSEGRSNRLNVGGND